MSTLQAPVLAVCSVAALAALKPADRIYVVSMVDAPGNTAYDGQAGSGVPDLQPSVRPPQPDAFIYEFLRSEELAATDLIKGEMAFSPGPVFEGASFQGGSTGALSAANHANNCPRWNGGFDLPIPEFAPPAPAFSGTWSASS